MRPGSDSHLENSRDGAVGDQFYTLEQVVGVVCRLWSPNFREELGRIQDGAIRVPGNIDEVKESRAHDIVRGS